MDVGSLKQYLATDISNEKSLRNSPQQERSRQSLEAVLRVCGEIIDESGHAGVTTAEVAKRAEMAIGTVYRFFPDRIALMMGVYQFMQDQYVALCIEKLLEANPTTWQETLGIMTDASVLARRTIPGFKATQYRILGDEESQEQYLKASHEFVAAVAGLLAQFDFPTDERWLVHLNVAVELSRALQRLAFDASPEGDPWLLDEARSVPVGYLEGHLVPVS
ncbi:TetR/AcrR family transcriptional regulator [Mycetocola miduiensis]|uniref:Transcriptional regulator, TetR family n=1 Tax=Mycetocola miduiensis TaxID=995034 RepID=A0A1I5DNW7_9MICO|nr:TetR/AcrR family transcriptional regulator [Mycetocola miduiensis]SFO00866.1 transcriptional regulator, TetR family [Mycetocola miduiensis]